MKDIPPSWIDQIDRGGYVTCYGCVNCGSVGSLYSVGFGPCKLCGGTLVDFGAAKWIQPRNPEWRWWRFWWPRYLPGKWVRADRGQEVVV